MFQVFPPKCYRKDGIVFRVKFKPVTFSKIDSSYSQYVIAPQVCVKQITEMFVEVKVLKLFNYSTSHGTCRDNNIQVTESASFLVASIVKCRRLLPLFNR